MHRPLLKFCVGHYLPDITFSLIGSMTLEVIASIVIIMFLSHFLKKSLRIHFENVTSIPQAQNDREKDARKLSEAFSTEEE